MLTSLFSLFYVTGEFNRFFNLSSCTEDEPSVCSQKDKISFFIPIKLLFPPLLGLE